MLIHPTVEYSHIVKTFSRIGLKQRIECDDKDPRIRYDTVSTNYMLLTERATDNILQEDIAPQ